MINISEGLTFYVARINVPLSNADAPRVKNHPRFYPFDKRSTNTRAPIPMDSINYTEVIINLCN